MNQMREPNPQILDLHGTQDGLNFRQVKPSPGLHRAPGLYFWWQKSQVQLSVCTKIVMDQPHADYVR